MTNWLQYTQLIYNISFVIFTFILVLYAVKEYQNNKKQSYQLISRINYCFTNRTNDVNIVNLNIFNCGDYVAKNVKIKLIINHNFPIDLDFINFIAPKENFEFYLGKRINKKLILYNGKELYLADPLNYDYFTENTNKNIITLTIRVIENP